MKNKSCFEHLNLLKTLRCRTLKQVESSPHFATFQIRETPSPYYPISFPNPSENEAGIFCINRSGVLGVSDVFLSVGGKPCWSKISNNKYKVVVGGEAWAKTTAPGIKNGVSTMHEAPKIMKTKVRRRLVYEYRHPRLRNPVRRLLNNQTFWKGASRDFQALMFCVLAVGCPNSIILVYAYVYDEGNE